MASFTDMNTQAVTIDRYVSLHENPAGAGDARPTALQIIKDNNLEGQLKDKVMLVTGASTGIGVDTTRALAATGARIILVIRDLAKGQKVIDELEKDTPVSKGRLEMVQMNLLSLDSVRAAAQSIASKTEKLHIMVNNAGVGNTPKTTTPDGFDKMMQVNYLSHFLLFQLLKPLLLASSTPSFRSRVVNVSSLAHRQSTVNLSDIHSLNPPYVPFASYGASKTAMNWMANEIDRRYAARGLHGISLHPGGMLGTNFGAEQDPAFVEQISAFLSIPGMVESLKSNEQGAATTVLAAVDRELEGKGGIYLDDCGTYGLADMKTEKMWLPGYAEWCFDGEGARRLWTEACKIVKVDE